MNNGAWAAPYWTRNEAPEDVLALCQMATVMGPSTATQTHLLPAYQGGRCFADGIHDRSTRTMVRGLRTTTNRYQPLTGSKLPEIENFLSETVRSDLAILLLQFDADRLATKILGCAQRRTAPHKRIEDRVAWVAGALNQN